MTGVDNGRTRTDIIMLGLFDIDNSTLDILQVPRDTYVESEHKYKKINTLYSYGEEEELRKGIARTFGIEIDRYMTVDIKGFHDIVDLIGGVEIYVDHNMKYSDPTQDLKINLKKGLQVLNGEQSEQYVRYRKGYADGDLGRINAQKKFLTAFLKQALKFSNVTKIPGMIKIGIESMKTDMTLDELGYFTIAALKLKSENISLFTAPGEPYFSKKDGASYFTLYKKETLEMINAHFNPYKEEIAEVDIAELAHKYDYVYTDYKGTSIADIDEKNERD
jgi:LCP family protein required for cell wall assembly